MDPKLDPEALPPRRFNSIERLRERAPYAGLDLIPDLPQHMARRAGVTRRGVVVGALAGLSGLTLGCAGESGHTGAARDSAGGTDSLPTGETGDSGDTSEAGETGDSGGPVEDAPAFDLSAWVNVAEDGVVTVACVKNEMGQGTSTGVAMLVAEEMDVDWADVRVVLAAELDEYNLSSRSSGTWGSTSISQNYETLREIGAAAREMLLAAAAARWGVDAGDLSTSGGVVSHPDHGELGYGELAEDASALTPPERPTVKSEADFELVGTDALRLDTRDHVEGRTVYGIDVVVDDMVYAAIKQSPVFGGQVSNLADLDVSGTGALAVVGLGDAVAVVAESWWVAQKALEGLDVQFEDPPQMAATTSSEMSARFASDLDGALATASNFGNAPAALADADAVVEAVYETPTLAHLCMEPMACTAHVTKGRCEIWAPTQYADGVREAARQIVGLPASSVTVHATALGGGFGRKAEADFAAQAVMIAREIDRPVKLIWSRAEDVQHDYYRPPVSGRIRAGIQSDGTINAWIGQAAGCGIFTASSTWNVSGFDPTYSFSNTLLQWAGSDYGIPFGYLRAPGYNKFTFMIESHVDQLAAAVGLDAGQVRLHNLASNPRAYAVMEAALQAADWGNPQTAGAAHGCAVLQYGSASYIALVAEVTVDESRKVRVHRVWCAVDIGVVVHPDSVRAQVEGSVIYSLSTGLYGEVTLTRGAVDQSNFHDFSLIQMHDAPAVETIILDSDHEPSGVGEHAVGPIIPAVTNAIYALTGERITALPITKHGFS